MKFNLFCIFSLILLSSKDALALNVLNSPELKKENLANIPQSKSIVSFSTKNNEQVVILDNPRYVVKGKLYDMWTKEQISNKPQLIKSKNTYPISKLKIDMTTLFGTKINSNTNSDYLLFYNPFDVKNIEFIKNNLSILNDKNIHVVFSIPSIANGLNDSLVKKFYGLSCSDYAVKTFDGLLNIKQNKLEEKPCGEQLYKTVGMLNFMKINTLPMLVSNKNDTYYIASESLDLWFKKN